MKKKLLTLGLVAALSATAAIGGTLAYFTDTAEKTNTFTVGNVDIELDEPNWEDHGKEDATNVYPGQYLDKDPEVTNIGKNPCFVRVSVSNLDQFVEVYGPSAMIKYVSDSTEDKLGSTDWVDGGDGYFYWTKVLNNGEKTDALFEQIIIPTNLTNDAETEGIIVSAEAVQSQGFTGDATKVEDLKTWFATCSVAAN